MSSVLRVAAVSYLNTRPLVFGLDSRPDLFEIRFDVPARCAELLQNQSVDLAMLSSIEYLRWPDYSAVPDIAVASKGPVKSVALYSTRPTNKIKSIALDSGSRTAVALLKVLCAQRFGIEPEFVTTAPDLPTMIATCDAALLIGDPALFVRHPNHVRKIDLGEEWTEMTGLPFVWAFWASRRDLVRLTHLQALRAARDTGTSSLDTIAAAHYPDNAESAAVALDYLHENLRFELDEDCQAGLERFFAAAVDIGIAPDTKPLRFLEYPAGPTTRRAQTR